MLVSIVLQFPNVNINCVTLKFSSSSLVIIYHHMHHLPWQDLAATSESTFLILLKLTIVIIGLKISSPAGSIGIPEENVKPGSSFADLQLFCQQARGTLPKRTPSIFKWVYLLVDYIVEG